MRLLKKYTVLFVFTAGCTGLLQCSKPVDQVSIVVTNTLDIPRQSESMWINLHVLQEKFAIANVDDFAIFDANDERIVSQIIDSNHDRENDALLFQANLAPGESQEFEIRLATPQDFPSQTFARFVPERMDDFAWENDRIAFRMYGPALQAAGEISSGVDVWVKSVSDLVIDKWYAGEDYHTDHGEGLDCYKVGPTLGCGGIAIWHHNILVPSKNFAQYKILENGPIRTTFELFYEARPVHDEEYSELKRISLDAGQHLNRFESVFLCKNKAEIEYAIGLVKREGEGVFLGNKDAGWMSYWEPENGDNGHTGVAAIGDAKKIVGLAEDDQHNLMIGKTRPDWPTVYYAGACWSKSYEFDSAAGWQKYVREFSLKLANPVKIEIH